MHGLFTQYVLISQKESLWTNKVAIIHDVQWTIKISGKYLVSDIFSGPWKSVISIPPTRIYHAYNFQCWWKEKLVKYQKFSDYGIHECLQNFTLVFMSLIAASIVKTVIFLLEFTLVF